MFERLSVPARQAIVAAHAQARGAGRKTISGADLMVGLLQVDGATAETVLRTYEFDTGEVDPDDDPDDFFGLVVAAAAGVAAARGTRSIGTVSLLLAWIALEPPSLTTMLERAGITVDELAGAARAVDDSGESLPVGDSMTASGDAVWIVTIGGSDPMVAWDDREE